MARLTTGATDVRTSRPALVKSQLKGFVHMISPMRERPGSDRGKVGGGVAKIGVGERVREKRRNAQVHSSSAKFHY